MKIGICDDSYSDRMIVLNWLTKNHLKIIDFNIVEFVSGEALLEYLRFNLLDIIFLDHRMNGMSGLNISHKIREQNKQVYIILLTEFILPTESCYDADINYFILKSNFQNKVSLAFNKFILDYNSRSNEVYTIRTDKCVVNLIVDEIVFIESEGRKKIIYLIDGSKYTINKNMSEIEDFFISKGFIKTHKSYIVNKKFIKSIRKNDIEIPLNYYIPLTPSRYKEAIAVLVKTM